MVLNQTARVCSPAKHASLCPSIMVIDVKQADSSLDSLMSPFNTRITELQELVIGQNMYPVSSITDLSAVDTALKTMELQVLAIKDRLHEETEAIPKAKKKLQGMSIYVPSHLPERTTMSSLDSNRSVSFLKEIKAGVGGKNGVYIVYMGAAVSANGSFKNDYVQLLSSISKLGKNVMIRSYRHGISGFAAHLSATEAQAIAQKPGVVSVFPDPLFQLHTTRSWDFLKYQTDLKIDSNPNSDSTSSSQGSDTITQSLEVNLIIDC